MYFIFGKYNGKLIQDIFRKDKQYIIWLCSEDWFQNYHKETYIFCNHCCKSSPIPFSRLVEPGGLCHSNNFMGFSYKASGPISGFKSNIFKV